MFTFDYIFRLYICLNKLSINYCLKRTNLSPPGGVVPNSSATLDARLVALTRRG